MKSSHPIIGITMAYDKRGTIIPDVEFDYIRHEYGESVRAAGGQPIFMDDSIDPDTAAQLCDGIIISGGQDIDPVFYGQSVTYSQALEPVERTAWERRLIDACDKADVHILGICYGLQLLNVHYGGTLYQDIAAECGSTLNHGSSAAAAMHSVTFEQEFLGYIAGDMVDTASRHHQAVRDVAPGFKVMARASDGVIEAIASARHYGIQWHSESDETARAVYDAFVVRCAGSRTAVSASKLSAKWFIRFKSAPVSARRRIGKITQ